MTERKPNTIEVSRVTISITTVVPIVSSVLGGYIQMDNFRESVRSTVRASEESLRETITSDIDDLDERMRSIEQRVTPIEQIAPIEQRVTPIEQIAPIEQRVTPIEQIAPIEERLRRIEYALARTGALPVESLPASTVH